MFNLVEVLEESDWKIDDMASYVPITQTWWYGSMQENRGRHIKRYAITIEGKVVSYVQFIIYPLISTLTYWYAPYGPILKNYNQDLIDFVAKEIKSIANPANAVFVRFDFVSQGVIDESIIPPVLTKASKISSHGSYYQPRLEWIVDISMDTDKILMNMHQKTRYSVRLAQKRGVETTITSGAGINQRLNDFLLLMKSTSKRNSFALHDDYYYKVFFDEIARRGNGFLIEAYYGDKLLASHLIVIEGGIANYVFGGTSDEEKDLCAPYLAHFNAMKESKLLGANKYNFGGISDEKEWIGITQFKKKFGGYALEHSPYYDLIINKFWYRVYNFRKFLRFILGK